MGLVCARTANACVRNRVFTARPQVPEHYYDHAMTTKDQPRNVPLNAKEPIAIDVGII
ncbi:hypothetical protein MED297_13942 [Reinekea sp. MED297]|uniref:Uncharacterized protein n=1 Tax=Reinekea blandensis MED297 TaxID=314283 RepID=A4BHY5_9GAMM|nr:hypothetical protein MED297_13942 [Reinekea sp. MED297] [Reinekea blandensis MED297]